MSDEDSIGDAVRSNLDGAADHLPLPPVPPDVSRRLRETFRSSLPIVGAELLHDSRTDDALVGIRGATGWSLSYRAGEYDIVLDLGPRGTSVRIEGQLLGPGPSADAMVRTFRGDELVSWGTTDDHGHFQLGVVPSSVDAIALSASTHVIEIPVRLRVEGSG